ncbi:MAG TPA: N-acetyltransferase [Ruminococcaceae bacterium]|nr:N-acetyltransferase [Oscillospiraceae bacterium]
MVRKIGEEDKQCYFSMARDFYSSDAVDHEIPEAHFCRSFDEMMRSDNYMAGYIIECEGKAAGYAVLAKTFSQEAGGMVLWIDELYVKPQYRCHGLGHEFFSYLKRNMPDNIRRVRLEVEDSNVRAAALYKETGFKYLDYSQMIKEI